MPRVLLDAPPDQGTGAHYRTYRDWLLENYFDHLCSYCLLRDDGVQVDHYEPTGYAPHREHDPSNLLLGCDQRNGSGGKSDYHPLHALRQRLSHDGSRYLVIDSRLEDFALLYQIAGEGGITARPGSNQDRARWNIVLLRLDREPRTRRRREVLRLLEACELVVNQPERDEKEREAKEHLLSQLLPSLSGYRLFFHVFGIEISDPLLARLRDVGRARP